MILLKFALLILALAPNCVKNIFERLKRLCPFGRRTRLRSPPGLARKSWFTTPREINPRRLGFVYTMLCWPLRGHLTKGRPEQIRRATVMIARRTEQWCSSCNPGIVQPNSSLGMDQPGHTLFPDRLRSSNSQRTNQHLPPLASLNVESAGRSAEVIAH